MGSKISLDSAGNRYVRGSFGILGSSGTSDKSLFGTSTLTGEGMFVWRVD